MNPSGCEGPLGEVKLELRPSWFKADPADPGGTHSAPPVLERDVAKRFLPNVGLTQSRSMCS